ncbi:MAG TPA: sugar phosphate isomerase/epimerase family protein [Bryobacterales bacterium]|nr:sugar phosphate isomerase/epimerase family protein [Bryobacterales bacterium]
MNRRNFLATAAASLAPAFGGGALLGRPPEASGARARFRSGIVAYSFREALKAGTMNYDDLVRLAVETGMDGIDMTTYWFPSTDDSFLLPLKRLAAKSCVQIYNLGIRVHAAEPTAEAREQQVAEIRKWVDVAQKMGATHIRVFGGRVPKDSTDEQAIGWAAETLQRGAEYAAARGVIIGLEDDGGITTFAGPTIEIVKRVDSPWVGINLDTGNFREPKVFDQIESCLPYAVTTHLKTHMRLDDGTSVPADWDRIFALYARHGYKGYMALEYEGKEEPKVAVPRELKRLRGLALKYSAA